MNEVDHRPQHQGHEHGHRSTHTDRYTRPMRAPESPLPEVRQAGPSQADLDPHRPHRRLQDHRLSGDHLRRIRRPLRCCKTFRNTPEGVLPKAKYDNKVRDLVLDRILDDGMNVERTLESIRREFLLDLSPGFVYDVLKDQAAQLDMSEHRAQGPQALQRHTLR